ncbi:hypothetical protein SteCoe_31248 [Stentor coeruleus]|uniref:Uncharacterized protein n=1 Tax=Stentor coeruleus TaxID=5963 RepID=A0A1R2B1U3_9CILI|nr:hypothetical protein SteCoe_31248 [Stentor coeruleus]
MDYSDENLESRWYQEHSLRLHKIRLQGIKERSPILSQSPGRYNSVGRRKPNFDPIKYQDFYRENKILYDKLSQISERKASPFTSKIPKSLNLQKRKKEARRIINANLDFLKRLTEKDSFVSAKKHKEEYAVLERYKKTISKANLQERLKKIALGEFKLPPIASGILYVSEKSKTEGCNKIISGVNEEDDKVKLRKKFSELIKEDEDVKGILIDGKKYEEEERDVKVIEKDVREIGEKNDDEELKVRNDRIKDDEVNEVEKEKVKEKMNLSGMSGKYKSDKDFGVEIERNNKVEEVEDASGSGLLSLELSVHEVKE